MKENVNTTNSPEIDWRAEYWKGVRDYIEQGDRLIEAHQRIIELTKELKNAVIFWPADAQSINTNAEPAN